MTVVVPPGFANVALVLKHDLDPDPWLVTFGVDTTVSAGDPTALGLNIEQSFKQTWGTRLSDDIVFQEIRLTIGQDAADNLSITVPVTNGRGAVSSNFLPQNCAALVHKYSGIGGRKNRGRYFMPGVLIETEVDAVGQVSELLRGQLEDAAVAFLGALELGAEEGFDATPMVILHNEYVPAVAPTPVIITGVSQRISTQRRRLR